MSSLSYNISNLPGIEDFFHDRDDIKITRVAGAKNTIAFVASEDPFPYLYFLDTKQVSNPSIDVSILDSYVVNKPLITAIDISSDGLYVVTGYNNGQIILWNTKLRIRVAYFTVAGRSQVNSICFAPDISTIFVALSNNQVHQLSLMSIMDYLTIKADGFFFPVRTPANQIKSMSFCDFSRVYVALSFEDSVRIIVPSDNKKLILEAKYENPIISLSNYEWTIYFAIASKNTIYVYSINDNDECNLITKNEFNSSISNIEFITSSILAVFVGEELQLVHISGKSLLSINKIQNSPKLLSSLDGSIIVFPQLIEIEQWKQKLDKLQKEGKFQEAISTALSIYNGDSVEFECSIDRDDIRDYINNLLVAFVKSGQVSQQDMLLIANAAIETESPQHLLRLGLLELADPKIQHPLIVALLSAAANRSDLAPSIVRKVIELNDVESDVLESFLMRITLPPSFTQEVIAFAKKKHFTRFLIHHFDSVYNNIFPIFADVVENGQKSDIAAALRHVFLSGEFEPHKSNICIVWIFDNSAQRVRKCFEADWSLSAQLFKVFLSRAPIKFSSSQKLTAEDIATTTAVSFDGAPLGSADNLFNVLAESLLSLPNVTVPSESLKIFISFIFESHADKITREKLFVRLSEKEFPGTILMSDFSQLCVSAGFSNVVMKYFGDIDYESVVTSILLSDSPSDAFDFLEGVQKNKSMANVAIRHRFNALLYLDPVRFVKLIVTKYKDLHPTIVQSLDNPATVIMYYESLFKLENESYATKDDSIFFIDFLFKYNINGFVKFVSNPVVLKQDEVYDLCMKKDLCIGCSAIHALKKEWSKSFEFYDKHLSAGGLMCTDLSRQLIENILEISTATPSKVIRTILNPLIQSTGGENDADLAREFLEISCSKIDRHKVLLAVLPLITSTLEKSRVRSTLLKFVKSFNCFYTMNKPKDLTLSKTLQRISEKSVGEALTSSSLTVIDGGDGVTLLSTHASDSENAKKMPSELLADVKNAFQGAESIFVEEGNRVSQDIDATIILLVDM